MYSAPNYKEAKQIIGILQRYKFTKTCYVGRPGPSFQYQLSGNIASNVRPARGEDIIRI